MTDSKHFFEVENTFVFSLPSCQRYLAHLLRAGAVLFHEKQRVPENISILMHDFKTAFLCQLQRFHDVR